MDSRICSSMQATTSTSQVHIDVVGRCCSLRRRRTAAAATRCPRGASPTAALAGVSSPRAAAAAASQRSVACAAGKDNVGGILRDALAAGKNPTAVGDAYRAGAEFLSKELGIDTPSEASRILDIAMNPNSLFVPKRSKLHAGNASARRLDVEQDMAPVVAFLKSQGLTTDDVRRVVSEHPPVLSYRVDGELAPLFAYLSELCAATSDAGGAEAEDAVGAGGAADADVDVRSVVVRRPSLLGLRGGDALQRIVGYLRENGYGREQILEYLATSL